MIISTNIFLWIGIGIATCLSALILIITDHTCGILHRIFSKLCGVFYMCAPRSSEDEKDGCCYYVCCNDEEYSYV